MSSLSVLTPCEMHISTVFWACATSSSAQHTGSFMIRFRSGGLERLLVSRC